MKAIRAAQFGGPDVMKLETLPDLQPDRGEVVVRVRAAGVNPVDTYIRSGAYRPDLPLPYTPGIDGAGTIEQTAEDVGELKIGQRVYFTWARSGSYAEQVRVAARHVFPLHENIGFEQGAALGVPYGTAYRALFQRAHALPDETLLVHGASGGVGLAAVQIARAAGLRVIGTAGTPQGLDLVRQEGAEQVFNHRTVGYEQRLMDHTGGRGVDIVLEMLADANLPRDLQLLALGGRIVIVGCRGTVELDPRAIMGREAAVMGMLLFNIGDVDLARVHAALRAGLEQGTLQPIVSRELPLAEAAQAHRLVMESHSLGKIVLIP